MIGTEDAIIAGLKAPLRFQKATFTGEAAGQMHNLFAVAGRPGAGALATPGLNGATVTSASTIGGMIPFTNPTIGQAYLAKLAVSAGANIIGVGFYDLLWYNSGIGSTTTTIQAVTTPTFPARDRNGSTDGDGIELWLHCSVVTGNAAAIANTTVNYTNSAGTTGRVAGLIQSWPASAVAGTVMPFGLQGSDVGVRAITNASGGGLTLGTSYVSGTVHLMAVREIAYIPFVGATSGALLDWAQLGLPQCFNDSAIYGYALLSGTAAGTIQGAMSFAHG